MAGVGELVSAVSGGPEAASAVCAPMPLLKWDLNRWKGSRSVSNLLNEQPAQGTESHALFNSKETFKVHDKDSLTKLHTAVAVDFKNLKANCIIERCDTELIRLFLDLDIEHETVNYELVKSTWLGPIVSAVLQCTGQTRTVVGIAAAPPKIKNGKTKTGIHLNFPDVLLPLEETISGGGKIKPFQVVVDAIKHMLEKHAGISDLDWDTVVDSSLYNKKKGLRMLFQSKLENCEKCFNKWKECINGPSVCSEKKPMWSRQCGCKAHADFISWKGSELGKVDHCPPLHACDGFKLWSVNRLYVPMDIFTCTLEQTGTAALAICVQEIPDLLRSLPFGQSLSQWIRADTFDLESVIEFFSIRSIDGRKDTDCTIAFYGNESLPAWVKERVRVETNNRSGRVTNTRGAADGIVRTRNVDVDEGMKNFFQGFWENENYKQAISKALNDSKPLGARGIEVKMDQGKLFVNFPTLAEDLDSKYCAIAGKAHRSNRNYFQLDFCRNNNRPLVYLRHKCFDSNCGRRSGKRFCVLSAGEPGVVQNPTCAWEGKGFIHIAANDLASMTSYLDPSVVTPNPCLSQHETHISNQADTQHTDLQQSSFSLLPGWPRTVNVPRQIAYRLHKIRFYLDESKTVVSTKTTGRPKKKPRLDEVSSQDENETETVVDDSEDQQTYADIIRMRLETNYDPSEKDLLSDVRKKRSFWRKPTNLEQVFEGKKRMGFAFNPTSNISLLTRASEKTKRMYV